MNMQPRKNLPGIVIADDDADDRMMITAAFADVKSENPLVEVRNGEELLDYLHRRGRYADLSGTPLPGLILLDLNMPLMDGREALSEIKSHPDLKKIPVVVLTTSKAQEDVIRSYDIGASAFIVKPVTGGDYAKTIRSLERYWGDAAEIPSTH